MVIFRNLNSGEINQKVVIVIEINLLHSAYLFQIFLRNLIYFHYVFLTN